jgi:glycosyltransferase involved in cell wall biosynthesis
MGSEDLLVWMAAFNEEKYISETLESLIGQTKKNIKILISENHSKDRTREIILKYASLDSRIFVIQPPTFMSAGQHGKWLLTEVIPKIPGIRYTCHIGAHDVMHKKYLEELYNVAEENPDCAIAYGNNIGIDKQSKPLKILGPTLDNISEIAVPIRPMVILTSMSWNVFAFGLWREDLRKKIPRLEECKAADHLICAEMSILGNIVHSKNANFYVRMFETEHRGNQEYIDKHLGSNYDAKKDFAIQLSWVLDLTKRACAGHLHYGNSAIEQVTTGATISAYISRYCALLLWDGPEVFKKFTADHNFINLLAQINLVNNAARKYIDNSIK